MERFHATTSKDWFERLGVPLQPTSAPEALVALTTVTEAMLRCGDARAAFPDVYGIITRRVSEGIDLGDRGPFLERAWISRLAGRFCERYLQTLAWSIDGYPQDASAWESTYAAGARGDVLPIQDVLLGLSAHINFDLAIGIYRTIADFGGLRSPEKLRRYKHDHDAVNDLLRASIPETFDRLVTRHRCGASALLSREAYAVSEWATMGMLAIWRARVWEDALALLHARDAGERKQVIAAMERRSRRYGRLLSISPGRFLVPHEQSGREPRTSAMRKPLLAGIAAIARA